MMDMLCGKTSRLKNGADCLIRPADLGDVEALLIYSRRIMVDDRFFLTTAEEARQWQTIEKTRDRIAHVVERSGCALFVAEVNGACAGQIVVRCGEKKRNSHIGEISISVLPEYRGLGIGHLLMEAAMEWAWFDTQIEKLELHAFASNERALALYRSMGFAEEGRIQRGLKMAPGQYEDLILMGLILEKTRILDKSGE